MIKKEELLNESKVFCMAPWVSIHVWPNGNVYPCCLWDSKKPVGNLNDENFKTILNNDKMKNTRLKMLNGESVNECERCNVVEMGGEMTPGYRKRLNKNFSSSFNLVENTKENGEMVDIKLKMWDIRISNLCNFKCRSCGYELSSAWYGDSIKMGRDLSHLKPIITIENKEGFMSELLPHFEHVEEIYFAGGEPLIMSEHYEILDKLIELNKTDVIIRYSTNFSKLIYKGKHIFDYWKMFPNLELFVSVDGIGAVGEYVRKGFDTEIFKSNVNEFLRSTIEFKQFGYIVTYSNMNYIHLFDLVTYLIKNELLNSSSDEVKTINIEFTPVTEPSYYSVTVLPENIKEEFKIKLNDFENTLFKLGVSEHIKTDIINKLYIVHEHSTSKKYNKEEYERFKMITSKLDFIRNEKLDDII